MTGVKFKTSDIDVGQKITTDDLISKLIKASEIK
jgi:hypothetical protein